MPAIADPVNRTVAQWSAAAVSAKLRMTVRLSDVVTSPVAR
jgi:hypothetical protein